MTTYAIVVANAVVPANVIVFLIQKLHVNMYI